MTHTSQKGEFGICSKTEGVRGGRELLPKLTPRNRGKKRVDISSFSHMNITGNMDHSVLE